MSGHESLKYWFLGDRPLILNVSWVAAFFSPFPPEQRKKASCSPFYRPNDCSIFEPLTNWQIEFWLLFARPSSLSLSLRYFFAQSSFSSGAGIFFLRVVRREWSDAIQFEKIRENKQGVGSRRRGGDEKQYFNRAREGAASSLRTRTPPSVNNNNKCIYLPNALRVDKRNRSPLSSNLLQPFPPIIV